MVSILTFRYNKDFFLHLDAFIWRPLTTFIFLVISSATSWDFIKKIIILMINLGVLSVSLYYICCVGTGDAQELLHMFTFSCNKWFNLHKADGTVPNILKIKFTSFYLFYFFVKCECSDCVLYSWYLGISCIHIYYYIYILGYTSYWIYLWRERFIKAQWLLNI